MTGPDRAGSGHTHSSRHPELIGETRQVLFNAEEADIYRRELRDRVFRIAQAHGLAGRLRIVC